MNTRPRHTIVTQGRLALRGQRLRAARTRAQGVQIVDIEQLAARLAGGFIAPLDDDTLRAAIQAVLPGTPLGELDAIKDLPGMVGAAADTLRKAWRAGIDLQARAGEHARLQAMAALERAVLAQLPPGMLHPPALAAAAQARLAHAPALLGRVDVDGLADLPPCWRPLLLALAAVLPLRWLAGPRPLPDWLDGSAVAVERSAPCTPARSVVSAATAQHEAIEAMRWARALLASGQARPEEIAIAAVTPADYDDHFLALRADSGLDLHFVHGVTVAASRDGQAAAALADVLLRGLSQARLRRLATLCAGGAGLLGRLPENWARALPADAPLSSAAAWTRLLDRLGATGTTDGTDATGASEWPEAKALGATLRAVVALLSRGHDGAAEAGEALLGGRALAIWRRALLAGPAAALDVTLAGLKQDDGLEACVCAAWMPASALASAPRRFVRLLGLNSSHWPRGRAEDRLLSDHIVPAAELDPLPVAAADRRDFGIILATTESEVVLSRARRDGEGRLLGRSPLLHGQPDETYLRRNAAPAQACSEGDRLLARPDEFARLPQAEAAQRCWLDWQLAELTPHDGLVRAGHPALAAVLARPQSASSLSRLLRNPLGYLWQYGLGWRAPEDGTERLTLDPPSLGNLVHLTLDLALQALEAQGTQGTEEGGLAAASPQRIAAAVQAAAAEAARQWEAGEAVPPALIWRRTLEDVRAISTTALAASQGRLPAARAFGEVPFGGMAPKTGSAVPWDHQASVEIPGTGLRIRGYIDRLDISGDGRRALVLDYKTGAVPDTGSEGKEKPFVLNGGKELQRCLYAFAVQALLGDGVEISAALLYPRDGVELVLDDPQGTLDTVVASLQAARDALLGGATVIGIDSGSDYDDLGFALPANAKAGYLRRKLAAATARLGDAARIWEAA
ncbi:PD-(D/E)XK nuclease family protein [Cupriavidus sp. USMAA2-4]|uniref:PD-(D/E)XK nuclease family protein n=1 Tax=Cupriavidus sp. USMAA2-4 TaxID=876364 RepID=UPI000ACD9BFD|nr:PD-(D/E)XK nuclease family protein [Cupriavidus sp. USMAA2-4]